MTRRTAGKGIPDLELKLEVCRKLLGAYTDRELADLVLDRPGQEVLAGKVADIFRKWKKHYPTKADGSAQFWDALVDKLGCNETVNGVLLVEAKIGQFVQYLPESRQERANEILAGINSPSALLHGIAEAHATSPKVPAIELHDADVSWIYLLHTGPVETIPTGLRIGKIDQRHYYLDPDSASGWSRLVRAEAYPTYDHCKAALQDLVASEPWKQALESQHPMSVVMLAGGGAPTKDLLLLRNLLSQPQLKGRVYYYLTDISMYMLRESALWIREHVGNIDKESRFSLRLVHGDVLDLKAMTDLKQIVHRHGKVIFGITGGTVGNFSESAFFRSLDRASDHGDLLIVSADTIDNMPQAEIESTLKSKYDHYELRQFLKPVIRAVLGESGSHESVDNALDRIRVSLRAGGDVGASDVTKSCTVIVTLDVGTREIILVTSTRYESSELTTFAARFGWQVLCQVPSPQNPHYKQFLFCRK